MPTPLKLGSGLAPAAGDPQISRQAATDILLKLIKDGDEQATLGASNQGPIEKGLGYIGAPGFVDEGDRGKTVKANKALVAKLVATLPDSALYASVLTQMDRRSIYTQVASQASTSDRKIGDVSFTPAEQAQVFSWATAAHSSAESSARALAATSGIPAEQVNQFVQDQLRVQPNVLTRSSAAVVAQAAADPTAAAAAKQAGAQVAATPAKSTTPGSFADVMQGILAGTTSTAPKFLTDGDVQALFRFSSTDLGAINSYESALAQARQTGNVDETFKVKSTGMWWQTEPAARQQAAAVGQGGKSYTIAQATNLLYGMKPDQVKQVQTALQKAGYYVSANGASGALPMFVGDATDQRTQAAWQALVGDSIRTGQPLFDTLTKRTATAAAAIAAGTLNADGTPKQDIALTDSAAISADSDTMATKALGRKLTDDEHAKVVEFIHGLEQKAQTTANQPGAQTVEQPDVSAEIDKYLTDSFPNERQGHDVADQYAVFGSLLAGPGGPR